jgi:glycosyltransferase involved in cell wall biosynthesis
MRREIVEAGIDEQQTSVVSVPPQEVPRYLAASDVGLLLRDDSIVNRVASPVKFGEYLAAGLPVIITEGLGDYSDAVRTHALGSVISLGDSDDSIQHRLESFTSSDDLLSGEMRRRCRSYAIRELSWTRHLPRVAEVYRRLAISNSAQYDRVLSFPHG